jgi:hypothetical protein
MDKWCTDNCALGNCPVYGCDCNNGTQLVTKASTTQQPSTTTTTTSTTTTTTSAPPPPTTTTTTTTQTSTSTTKRPTTTTLPSTTLSTVNNNLILYTYHLWSLNLSISFYFFVVKTIMCCFKISISVIVSWKRASYHRVIYIARQ